MEWPEEAMGKPYAAMGCALLLIATISTDGLHEGRGSSTSTVPEPCLTALPGSGPTFALLYTLQDAILYMDARDRRYGKRYTLGRLRGS